MSSPKEKEGIALDEINSIHIQHVDGLKSAPEMVDPQKGAVNAFLILACIAFGSASFLFGYDDKVISPIAALTAYVISLSICQKSIVGGHRTDIMILAGRKIPGSQPRHGEIGPDCTESESSLCRPPCRINHRWSCSIPSKQPFWSQIPVTGGIRLLPRRRLPPALCT